MMNFEAAIFMGIGSGHKISWRKISSGSASKRHHDGGWVARQRRNASVNAARCWWKM